MECRRAGGYPGYPVDLIPVARVRPRGVRGHVAAAGAAVGRGARFVFHLIVGLVATALGI